MNGNRQGSLYLPVLGACFIMSFMALAGMSAARVHLESTTSGNDLYQARLLAQSGIEYGIAQLANNNNWQTLFTLDTDNLIISIAGGGTATWRLASPSGQSFVLQGIGTFGQASCTYEVDLSQPLDLDCALLAGGDITVNSGCELVAEDAPVATNQAYINSGATTANVEAQSVSGNSINGSQTVPGPIRNLPTPSSVFEYYEREGTVLSPGGFSTKIITLTTLSPNSSFGATNTDGIYVINTNGENLSISSSRIVGTLVVTDLAPGKKVTLSGDINWEPAYPNFPALIVDGDVEIKTYSDGWLSESFITPNYNPVGTPYKGQTDDSKDDEYISSIAGIIYCTGNLTICGSNSSARYPDLRGLVIAGGNCNLVDNIFPTLRYDETFALDPPPGFTAPDTVSIVPGSWREVTQ